MSNIDIQGVVDNINKRTNVYTPLIEAIVNSIQAIDKSGRKDGLITLVLKRMPQQGSLHDNEALPDFVSAEIIDNGIGFNDENINSFDTLYGSLKRKEGGKGFGRFMFLKYFNEVKVKSVFNENNKYKIRFFKFGKRNEIIEEANVGNYENGRDTETIVYLNDLNVLLLDKTIKTIARKLMEKLLIFFITDGYHCPKIVIKDNDNGDSIVLNDLLIGDYAEIKQIVTKDMDLDNGKTIEKFKLKVFKIYYPENQRSKISLAAHKREVTETPISMYVPEFEDNFFDEAANGEQRNYLIKTYVLGNYLDNNVTLERITFNFPNKDRDTLYAFTKEQIEREAANVTSRLDEFKNELRSRKEKKKTRIKEYVDKLAPWHKSYIDDLDLSEVPYHLDDERIDLELQRTKFRQETLAKRHLESIMSSPSSNIDGQADQMLKMISKANVSDLAHYIASRKYILDFFKKSLEVKENGKYSVEDAVHKIIFPTKTDSDTIPFNFQNLWIIDERLNFTEYVSSDKPLNGGTTERVDLLVFNNKIALRGGEGSSNAITIFEFKRPQRDDFVGLSEENPIQQLTRYVNDIRSQKYKTPKGRDIAVSESTPFYGYVVCDFTSKVKDWLYKVENMTPMADEQGYFTWKSNINLYIEVISWDKLINDAQMRNKIFFHKLGLE